MDDRNDRETTRNDRKQEPIRLDPPADSRLILPLMMVLFLLAGGVYSYWFSGWNPTLSALVLLGTAAVVVHLIRLAPHTRTRYLVDEEGIRVFRNGRGEDRIPWKEVRTPVLFREWLILPLSNGRKLRIRLSLFEKEAQRDVRRILRQKFPDL